MAIFAGKGCVRWYRMFHYSETLERVRSCLHVLFNLSKRLFVSRWATFVVTNHHGSNVNLYPENNLQRKVNWTFQTWILLAALKFPKSFERISRTLAKFYKLPLRVAWQRFVIFYGGKWFGLTKLLQYGNSYFNPGTILLFFFRFQECLKSTNSQPCHWTFLRHGWIFSAIFIKWKESFSLAACVSEVMDLPISFQVYNPLSSFCWRNY